MKNQILINEIDKLENARKKDNILNHPVVKILLSTLNIIPAVGSTLETGVDSSLNFLFKKKQEERLLSICEIIISDDKITTEMVKDVKEIMSFAKMLDVARKLITNDKLDYLARLYKNLITQDEKDYDEYEEFLRRLDELSFREIEMLHILDKLDLVIEDLNAKKQREEGNFEEERHNQIVRIESKWLKFQDIIEKKFQIDSVDLQGYMQSISRSGFCVQYKVTDMPIRANSIYGITKFYRNFAKMIYQ